MNKFLVMVSLMLALPMMAVAQRGGDHDYEQDDEIKQEVSGQDLYQGAKFHYGPKVGINFTTFDSDCDDVQARVGQMGALCRWQWEHWALQTELFFAKMGVRSLEKVVQWRPDETWRPLGQSVVGHDDELNERMKLMYISKNVQLPVLAKWYTPFFYKGFNLQGGILFSYRFDYDISTPTQKGYLMDPRLAGTIYTNTNGIVKETGVRKLRRIANDVNLFTVHALWGVGFDSKTGIGVDLRCQMGLMPVWKCEKTQYNSHSHDRVWSLSFSYVF